MKKFLVLIIALISSQTIFSQDYIKQKNGDTLKVKITELADDFVKYYHYDDPNKIEIKMNRSLIRDINLEYGRVETSIDPGLNESYFVDDNINNVKVNFLGFSGNATILTYERSIDPFSSWDATIKIHGAGIDDNDNIDKSGFGLEAGYKIKFGKLFRKNDYRPKHLLAGSYLKPTIGYTSATEEDTTSTDSNNEYDYNYFHGGLDIGKQWILNNKLSLDPFLGFHYYGGDFEATEGFNELDVEDLVITDGNMVGVLNRAFRYGLNVGYTF